GPRPLALPLDLYTPDAPARIRDAALSAYGRVDILVNNAGGSRPIPSNSPDAAWDESFSINFTGVRRTTQALLPARLVRRLGPDPRRPRERRALWGQWGRRRQGGRARVGDGPLARDGPARDHDQLPVARASAQRADRPAAASDATEPRRVRDEHPARLLRRP